ncbi:methionine/alanine import family NSS transporter small subunit [Testudinibacter sp. TR-2022]|nr:methionine/alanine import family NSS transporter small subunit [Testudinibacter sp. TR-2022]TNH09478.1 methionine/alanine import family NSS transporter small subunit [Pasteurellaceae bacterium Phil11]TNH21501.1 methionine/alanine import family NSS transporter small subunit [Testudinibacter sp. TR-2022]TNH28444.1 methionine/alanine import family NSS transporter small subunit [Testudinibacter sp. TR-2022]
MSTSAIIMMVIALVIIWGGLIVAVKRLPEEKSED